jgi:hypothetical protein
MRTPVPDFNNFFFSVTIILDPFLQSSVKFVNSEHNISAWISSSFFHPELCQTV